MENNISKTTEIGWKDIEPLPIKDSIQKGTKLVRGEYLQSKNQEYMAIMQDDGNFVIYKGNKESGIPIWSTLTQDPYKGEYFVFQNNGNIEVFSQNELIWTANTKNEHANKLIMKDDGDLDIQDENEKTIWTSDTIGGIDRRPWVLQTGHDKLMVYRYTNDKQKEFNNYLDASIISIVENKKEKKLVKTDKINVALGICGVFILFLIFFLIAFFVKFFNNSPIFGYADYRTQL